MANSVLLLTHGMIEKKKYMCIYIFLYIRVFVDVCHVIISTNESIVALWEGVDAQRKAYTYRFAEIVH